MKKIFICLSLIGLLSGLGCRNPNTPPELMPGDARIFPARQTVSLDTSLTTEILVNSGESIIGTIGFIIKYDSTVIAIDDSVFSNGIEAGEGGFSIIPNGTEADKLVIGGFTVSGAGPGEEMHLLTIHWQAVGSGTTDIELVVDNLSTPLGADIGVPESRVGYPGIIIVE